MASVHSSPAADFLDFTFRASTFRRAAGSASLPRACLLPRCLLPCDLSEPSPSGPHPRCLSSFPRLPRGPTLTQNGDALKRGFDLVAVSAFPPCLSVPRFLIVRITDLGLPSPRKHGKCSLRPAQTGGSSHPPAQTYLRSKAPETETGKELDRAADFTSGHPCCVSPSPSPSL